MQGADSAAALGNFLGWLVANGASNLHAWAAEFGFGALDDGHLLS